VTAPPVDQARADLELLLGEAQIGLSGVWVTGSAETVRDALEAALPDLVALYGSAAASLAADWYDESRDQARVDGRFQAIVADLPDLGATEALAGWGTGPLFQAEPDMEAARSQVEGGFQKIVGDMHRDTVIRSLSADPQAKGWIRQTTGKSCNFCVMIAARGAVYSAHTANFSSHNHCDCIAVPAWGDPVDVVPYVPSQRFREQSQRDANNARIREFLRTN
jgi:hypothetical protein